MRITWALEAILAGICMGTMGLFSRKSGFSSEMITFFRLMVGSSIIALVLLLRGRILELRIWPGIAVFINGLMLAGFIIFYVHAMSLTTMANSIMVVYLAPLTSAIYAHYFLGEKLTLPSVILICSALFGFAMMMEFKIDFSEDRNHLPGLGFACLSLLCYTAFILINRKIDPAVPVFTRTYYQMLTGALCMVPFCIPDIGPVSLGDLGWAFGAGVFPGFLGILLAVMALEKLPAATFGTLAYFEPICVVVIGFIVFGESLSLLQLCGCGLIILSGTLKTCFGSCGTSSGHGAAAVESSSW